LLVPPSASASYSPKEPKAQPQRTNTDENIFNESHPLDSTSISNPATADGGSKSALKKRQLGADAPGDRGAGAEEDSLPKYYPKAKKPDSTEKPADSAAELGDTEKRICSRHRGQGGGGGGSQAAPVAANPHYDPATGGGSSQYNSQEDALHAHMQDKDGGRVSGSATHITQPQAAASATAGLPAPAGNTVPLLVPPSATAAGSSQRTNTFDNDDTFNGLVPIVDLDSLFSPEGDDQKVPAQAAYYSSYEDHGSHASAASAGNPFA